MATIIIFEDGASEQMLSETTRSAQQAGSDDIRVISRNPQSGTTHIASNAGSLNEQIATALAGATESVVLVNASAGAGAALSAMANAAKNGGSSVTYAAVNCGEELIDPSSLSADRLVDEIAGNPYWPIAAVGASRSMLEGFQDDESSSAREYLAKVMILGVVENESVDRIGTAIKLNDTSSAACTLTNTDQARLLTMVVNSCNIEELFPMHAWKAHEEESAAASFHSLAAIFLRLNDGTSALQCLSWSDRLEDSPRSLALKAMIAREKGETLGAVANLVSSLQQYEKRKRNDENQHYLSFSPENLDEVNRMLSEGLEALNKRDNERAYGLFEKAVYSFDPFFKQYGIGQRNN